MTCSCDLTVQHILVECGDFMEVRQRHYDTENIGQFFQEISVVVVFIFLQERGLFDRIYALLVHDYLNIEMQC